MALRHVAFQMPIPSLPDVPWSRIAAFVRQHTHDLRNELNGLDLEAALLADIVTDPEAQESVTRLRGEVRKVAAGLRALSAKFAEARVSPVRLAAREVLLIWKDQAAEVIGESTLQLAWDDRLDAEEVNVDPSSLTAILEEILSNAIAFPATGPVRITAAPENGSVVFAFLEPKSTEIDTTAWGELPLVSSRRGGYGLGLCALKQIVTANGGKVTWSFSPAESALITQVSFPAAA